MGFEDKADVIKRVHFAYQQWVVCFGHLPA
jgi:hypothetical protein